VLLTAWRFLRHCGSPQEAEAEACLHGLRLAVEWIQQPMIVESDCKTLIDSVQGRVLDRSQWAGLLAEIRAMSTLLPECRFQHVKTEGNKVAHLLAKQALQQREFAVKRFDKPECVRSQCNLEAAGTNRPNACTFVDSS
jgi:ribonuclease HI